jgi:hypothetical protein
MSYNALIGMVVAFCGVALLHAATVGGWKYLGVLARMPLPSLLVVPALEVALVVLMLPLIGNAAGTLMMWAILDELPAR